MDLQTFYNIPVIHYNSRIMEKVSFTQAVHWREFMKTKKILEKEGMVIIIVPLSLDTETQVWWTDYPGDYVREYNLNPKNLPELIVTIKVDKQGHYIQKFPIYVDHMDIKKTLKKKLLETFKYPWFSWSRKEKDRMIITL